MASAFALQCSTSLSCSCFFALSSSARFSVKYCFKNSIVGDHCSNFSSDHDHFLGQKFYIFFCFLFLISGRPRELSEKHCSGYQKSSVFFLILSLNILIGNIQGIQQGTHFQVQIYTVLLIKACTKCTNRVEKNKNSVLIDLVLSVCEILAVHAITLYNLFVNSMLGLFCWFFL